MKKFWLILLVLAIALTGCVRNKKKDLPTRVDEAIANFIERYSHDYIKESDDGVKIEPHVASALAALKSHGYPVSLDNYLEQELVKNYYDNLNIETTSLLFAALFNSLAFQINYDSIKDAWKQVEAVETWDYAYALLALNITKNNAGLTDSLRAVIGQIHEEHFRDADFA